LAKIGLILPFHGPAPRDAEATHVAVRDALLASNRAGGVLGHRLELVSLDSWNDPATARLRAAELLADPLVLAALVGGPGPAHSDLATAGVSTLPVAGPADGAAALAKLLGQLEASLAAGAAARRQ
jgi:hypothetical protein